MKRQKIFRLRLEDESHLHSIADLRVRPAWLIVVAALFILACFAFGALIIMVTPMHNLLPGYMKTEQRSASEENLMRLDSVMNLYQRNQAYIDNYLKVTDLDRNPEMPADTASYLAQVIEPDSLSAAGKAEQRFVKTMEERERFNISVLAPLAADGMTFYPVCDGSIFTSDSRKSTTGLIILPKDEIVKCAAEGTVLASFYSIADKGYVIVIQHPRGFATRYAHLGAPMISTGDNVTAGQALAMAPDPNQHGARVIRMEMWHQGLPVIPYDYVGNTTSQPVAETPYEAPRGR